MAVGALILSYQLRTSLKLPFCEEVKVQLERAPPSRGNVQLRGNTGCPFPIHLLGREEEEENKGVTHNSSAWPSCFTFY